jgi:hypothetical protein
MVEAERRHPVIDGSAAVYVADGRAVGGWLIRELRSYNV